MMASVTQSTTVLGDMPHDNASYDDGSSSYYVTADYKVPLPLETILLKSIVVAILIILTVFGNTVVITIIVKNKQLRGTTYYYLLNLAVADILIAIFAEWTWLVHEIKRYWIFGKFMCKFATFCQGISVQVSILTLTIIAIDRYLAIIFPLKSRVTSRNGGAGIFILAVWLIAIGVNIPLLLKTVYFDWTWYDGHYRQYCYEEWGDGNAGAIYTTVLVIVTYIAPLGLMMFVYLTIATKLLISRAPGERIESTVSSQERTKRKVLKMLVVVVCSFALCWLPYHVHSMYMYWKRVNGNYYEPNDHVVFAVMCLGYTNSALNPFIYCGFNENFRQGFLQILTCNSKKYLAVNKDRYSKKTYTYPSHTDKTIIEQSI